MAFRILKNPDGTVKKVSFPEAYKFASEQPMGMISNSAAKTLSNRRVNELSTFRFWTGSIIAYPETGKAFEDEIRIKNSYGIEYCLDTSMFLGMRGAAIVFDTGSYDFVQEGKMFIVKPKKDERIDIIYNFPQFGSQRFAIHESTGVSLDIEGTVMMYRKEETTFAPIARSFESGSTIHLDQGFGEKNAVVLSDGASIPPKSSVFS
ncbi:hypothetical protein JXA56_01100 [Candidatus Micrarchaeota archaeon]|nr:hypothetical protein [Candidatus Micrarchaeota archaeon]